MGHREILAQVEVERIGRRREVSRAEQRERKAVHLFADCVVVFAEADEFAELGLEQLHLVPQRYDLALGKRDRAPAMRMRHVDRFEQRRILVEELRIGLEELRDVFGVH